MKSDKQGSGVDRQHCVPSSPQSQLQALADWCEEQGFILIAAIEDEDATTYAAKGTRPQTTRVLNSLHDWLPRQYRSYIGNKELETSTAQEQAVSQTNSPSPSPLEKKS